MNEDECNLKISKSAWDTNLCVANAQFVAVNLEASGGKLLFKIFEIFIGGAFAVLPHNMTGKLPDNMPVVNGHGGAVLDLDFNPFNDSVIASASEDSNVISIRKI